MARSPGPGVDSSVPLDHFVSPLPGTVCPGYPEGWKECLKAASTLGSLLGKFWAALYHQAGWLPVGLPSIFLPEGVGGDSFLELVLCGNGQPHFSSSLINLVLT